MGEGQDHVAGVDHAQVAMQGLHRVQVDGGGAVEFMVAMILRATMPDLPMPVAMNLARGVQDQAHGLLEAPVQAIFQPQDGFRLHGEHVGGGLEDGDGHGLPLALQAELAGVRPHRHWVVAVEAGQQKPVLLVLVLSSRPSMER